MGRFDPVVVQGTPVSIYDNQAVQTYSHNATGNTAVTYERGTKQVNRCRDPFFAFLLYANVGAIVAVAASFGSNPFTPELLSGDASSSSTGDYSAYVYTALGCGVVALGLSAFMLTLLMWIPSFLIKFSLIMNIFYGIGIVIIGFSYGSLAFGIVGLVLLALTVCYTYFVWNRIPFATANLVTACSAVRTNFGVNLIAYFMVALAFGWSILWTVAVTGIADKLLTCGTLSDGTEGCSVSSKQYGYLFLLFLSLFFTHQVLQNSVHTTVSGVVGTWWYVPSEAHCCCSAAVRDSFVRTMTTSFGSVCFGSLLVAIIQAVRQIANQARANGDANPIFICIADCILGCLESILEYFNKWAFVYVGLYGYSYIEAGKNVITLFKNRGWEAIIADDLVGTTLFFLSLAVGLITGAVGILFETQTQWYANIADGGDPRIVAFIIGFIVGLFLCSILMSTIASAVNATIVCFAEGPAEFQTNHPKLSEQMRAAWSQTYPGCF